MLAQFSSPTAGHIAVVLACLGVLVACQSEPDRMLRYSLSSDDARAILIASSPRATPAAAIGNYLDPAAADDARSGVEEQATENQDILAIDITGCNLTEAWMLPPPPNAAQRDVVVVGLAKDATACEVEANYRAYFLVDRDG